MKMSVTRISSVAIAIGLVLGLVGVTAGAANATGCSRQNGGQTLNSLLVAELKRQQVAASSAHDVGTSSTQAQPH